MTKIKILNFLWNIGLIHSRVDTVEVDSEGTTEVYTYNFDFCESFEYFIGLAIILFGIIVPFTPIGNFLLSTSLQPVGFWQHLITLISCAIYGFFVWRSIAYILGKFLKFIKKGFIKICHLFKKICTKLTKTITIKVREKNE